MARRSFATDNKSASAVQLNLFDDQVPPTPALPGPLDCSDNMVMEHEAVAAPISLPTMPQPLLLSDVVPLYLHSLVAQGRSIHTIRSFKLDLGLLQRFVGDRPVTRLTRDELGSFIAWVRQERSNEPNSLRHKIAALKNFCAFLQTQGFTPTNEAARLMYPEIFALPPDFLAPAAVERLLETTEHNPFWRALLLVMLDAGLKRDEVLALRPVDLSLKAEQAEHCYLVVRETEAAKRLRARRLQLTPRLKEALLAYEKQRADNGSAWITSRLFDVTPRGVNFIVETCGKVAGVTGGQQKLTPQILRETFAMTQMSTRVAAEQQAQANGMSEALMHQLIIRHNQEVLELLGLRDDPDTARKYRRLIGT